MSLTSFDTLIIVIVHVGKQWYIIMSPVSFFYDQDHHFHGSFKVMMEPQQILPLSRVSDFYVVRLGVLRLSLKEANFVDKVSHAVALLYCWFDT